MSLYLVVILSALFATSSGNIFSAFSPLSALRSFSPFSSFPSFGSSFSNFPFGQPYASSYSSNDPFNSAYSMSSSPFQNTFSPTPQAASPFGSGFSAGVFPFPSFPPMPSFPSFNNFPNGNGFKVTSTSSEGKDGSSGQVTIQVEKIGDEKKPGEQRRIVQTFRTAGPLVPSNQMKGKVKNNADRQRIANEQPNNQRGPQQKVNRPIISINQLRKPSFAKPTKLATPTKISPLNELSINDTTSHQHSFVGSVNRPIRQEKNNYQLIKNNGATVSSSKTSSSLSTSSTSQNISNKQLNNQKGPQQKVNRPIISVNQLRKPSFAKPTKLVTPTKISPLNELSMNDTASHQHSFVSSVNRPIRQEKNNNQLIKNNGATVSSSETSSSLSTSSTSQNISNENRSSFSSVNSKITSNPNSQSKAHSGVTVKRVDSSGRVTTGFIQP